MKKVREFTQEEQYNIVLPVITKYKKRYAFLNYDEDLFTEKEFVEMLIEEVHPGDEDESIIFGSSKITDTEKYSNSEIKLMNKELEDEDGYIEIEKYVRATGTIDIKVDGEKNTYEFSAYIIKAGGSWYIASMTVYSWPIGD